MRTFQNTSVTEVEFGRLDYARQARDELPNEALDVDDDGREKRLIVDKDAIDRRTMSRVEGLAADSRDSARGDMHGQAELTQSERNQLDFSRTTIPEARTAKASLQSEGVDDWVAHFDPTLTTSEMADKARDSAIGGGQRMDAEDSVRAQDRRHAEAFREVQGQAERRARDGCEQGFEDACDQLVEEFGFERAEAEQLLRQRQAEAVAQADLQDTSFLRAATNGRYLQEPPEPAPNAPGWRKASTGRFIGYDLVDPRAKRHPETGHIAETDPIELSRREARARYGDPDGGSTSPGSREEAKREALFEFEPMDRGEDIMAQAAAADVTLSPDEADPEYPAGATGRTAMGGFNPHYGGEVAPNTNTPLDETPPDIARGDDPFDMSENGGLLSDDRDRQGTLDAGLDAGTTRDRSGEIAGSAGFEDRRDELQPDNDAGEQTGLVEVESDIGDGQTDLFGGSATETTGGEYR
ncbi:uncharacterized protein NP_7044A (plasmid) [Natronomonas pharaonis DSM 2160]|uniref:Uncharacterized protein n=1 Tax=Natronomonas pharaonis (strain ATCC 35678 / DSM 2160 / CIP 103997 / JCM 8858 / NBRC 14720 / NCIMB 2260 / Gabara) TaxID=348780 RepID=Q3ILT2_NATPD|nr:hypothetical protein [Natronomonas pharaonis]CAI49751.1 uncharacterized protein NP_3320A [Natronomonas pharaonis DSM 2160]CAI50938.1 uncharacterized protein NP_7044A [Natronomonas pharaonis DSM 2160]